MKKIMIEIPDNEIPEKQEVITCDIHFVDGKVCECTYPFEEVNENELETLKLDYDSIKKVEQAKQIRCNSCQNNTDELSGECYECVKEIKDWYKPIFDKNKSVKINGIETDFIIVDKNSIIDIEELEEIKDEIINAYDFFPVPFGSHKAIQVIDNHIKEHK